MKTIYRIEAWCECKDLATRDTIFNDLVTRLKAQKTAGNITVGNVLKLVTEQPEETRVNEGV